MLSFAVGIDCAAILGAGVIALPVALRGIMTFPKGLEQRLIADFCRIEYDKHNFGMASVTGANLFICCVWREAASIPDGGRKNAVTKLPKQPLRAPKAAEREYGLL